MGAARQSNLAEPAEGFLELGPGGFGPALARGLRRLAGE